jgi:multiple sugar transport system substrate-binding protein
MEKWINLVAGAKFYPAAKAEWMDVKLGVIDAQQRILLGEDAQTVLDELQADIAG